MKSLERIAKCDGVIATTWTTVHAWDRQHVDAGDRRKCCALDPWIGAAVSVGKDARVLVGDQALRIMVDGVDVVAVVFEPGHVIVKSLARMMRRVIGEAKGARVAEVERRLAEARAKEDQVAP